MPVISINYTAIVKNLQTKQMDYEYGTDYFDLENDANNEFIQNELYAWKAVFLDCNPDSKVKIDCWSKSKDFKINSKNVW